MGKLQLLSHRPCTQGFTCPNCSRMCRSRIGLHREPHKTLTHAERDNLPIDIRVRRNSHHQGTAVGSLGDGRVDPLESIRAKMNGPPRQDGRREDRVEAALVNAEQTLVGRNITTNMNAFIKHHKTIMKESFYLT
ncbi:hypothetical protein Bbelb_134540 [Branchiostoma belcheri]|nr:hypothetical protein Bbelb_134540 [Branchiostoma belcheri]